MTTTTRAFCTFCTNDCHFCIFCSRFFPITFYNFWHFCGRRMHSDDKFRAFDPHTYILPSQATWNNREMIAGTWSFIFRWHPRCRRCCPCLVKAPATEERVRTFFLLFRQPKHWFFSLGWEGCFHFRSTFRALKSDGRAIQWTQMKNLHLLELADYEKQANKQKEKKKGKTVKKI